MPKTTLTKVVPNISGGDPGSLSAKYIFVPESTVTFHSELISLVHPFYNDREKKFESNYSVITLTNILQPIVVKASVSAIEALMENQPYLPVSDGSGGSLSGGSSGSGFSGSGSGDPTSSTTFKGSLSTTFNGACQANTTATYYHTGSGTLPAAGNQVFINSNHSTAMADGYYGIAASGSGTATHSMRVVAGYVASGWPIACGDLEQVPEP